MSDSTVALIRCNNYQPRAVREALQRQFELLGGLDKFVCRGDHVLLKPNFIAPKSRRHATQTHPVVIVELAKLLIDFGAKPFVADSPAWGNVYQCVRKLKLEESLGKLDVPIRQLNKPNPCRIGCDNTKVGISSLALDADVIINLPKFKTHQQLVATFAVKNMFGCVSGKAKALWHFRRGKTPDRFCKLLIDIYIFLNPALTIIDGIMAMDGPGPIKGRTRPLGYLLAGTEPIALETVCAKLINLDVMELPIVRAAKKMGLSPCELQEIQVLGDDYTGHICADFQLAIPAPIRFSLPHVFKSISKQIVLLSSSAAKKLLSKSS